MFHRLIFEYLTLTSEQTKHAVIENKTDTNFNIIKKELNYRF